jgi:hypothetical protein
MNAEDEQQPMPPPPRYSDLEPDEVLVRQPSRTVVLILIALGIVMLVLAALSSERVGEPPQRQPDAVAPPTDALPKGEHPAARPPPAK